MCEELLRTADSAPKTPPCKTMVIVPRRLALKLILSLTVIVMLVEGILGYFNVKTQERQLLDVMILGADQLSKGITSATWHAMLADNRNAAYEVMQTIALKQGIDRIRIFNRSGRVMFSTKPEASTQADKTSETCSMCHSALEPKVKIDAPSRSSIFTDPGEDGRRKLAMITPIYNEAACSNSDCHAHPAAVRVLGVLDLAMDLDTVDQEIRTAHLRTFIVVGIQILLIGLFTIFFTRHFVDSPIKKLIAGTKQVGLTRLDSPIEIHGSVELEELASSFNDMRRRLNQSIDEINQFTQSLETKVQERTEQLKVAQRKLVQSDRLASLGQLSASVAHEINNPLSGVLNLSKLMQRIIKEDGIPVERIPEFRRYLSQVVDETSRAGRIVTDLLTFSRRPKPQRTPVDLNGIIESTLSIISHKLKLANVELSLHLSPNLPPVQCDASQMQQVIINLVMNAAEATVKCAQGIVTLSTLPGPGNVVVLEIRDNGEGIPPQNLPKIFDPFFTTKEEGKGVGLGLAVVYGIIDSHGGDIEVTSNVGTGTLFTVTLPASPAATGPARGLNSPGGGA
jgi:two-component system, NtrC family, sensor kinase